VLWFETPVLSDPSLTPTIGDSSTNFTFAVTYTQADNQAPEYAYAAIVKPDGNKILKAMTTTDTTYSNRSLHTCATKLPAGSHSYYFQFKGAGKVVKTSTASGPVVYSAPTLSGGALAPTSGTTATDFLYEVVYSQPEDQAPVYVYAVILKPDGNKLWKGMSGVPGYWPGAVFSCTTKLPVVGALWQLIGLFGRITTYAFWI